MNGINNVRSEQKSVCDMIQKQQKLRNDGEEE